MGDVRDKVIFAGLFLLLLAAGGVGYWVLLDRTPGKIPPPPPSPAAEEIVVERLVVTRLAGPVRIRRAGSGVSWVDAQIGDELHKDDLVETGEGGSAQLSAGESYQVELDSDARFDVQEITAELSRFGLAAGLLNASVRDDPRRTVEIESASGLARTRGADFAVASSDKVVAVGVRRGQAELESSGGTTLIRAGQQSLAVKGAAPAPAMAIPPSLLLKVAWPSERVTNQRKLVVKGKTAPGSILAIEGQPVQVSPDGTFRHVVYLREGRQTLNAVGRDVGGHVVDVKGPEILLQTRGASAEFETKGLWKDDGK
jgi:hypothetical protein